MNAAKIVRFCVSFLLAFLALLIFSFLSLRPALKDMRVEISADWEGFVRESRERNRVLTGLIEAVRGFEPGQARLAAKMLEAQAVSTRSSDPHRIVAAVNEMEQYLTQIGKLARSRPEIDRYPPFAAHWSKVVEHTYRVDMFRRSCDAKTRAYNRLLTVFPQNILAAVFGFVPLNEYPMVRTVLDN
jgi:LemA protein